MGTPPNPKPRTTGFRKRKGGREIWNEEKSKRLERDGTQGWLRLAPATFVYQHLPVTRRIMQKGTVDSMGHTPLLHPLKLLTLRNRRPRRSRETGQPEF